MILKKFFAQLNQMSRSQALEDLSKFRVVECLHCNVDESLPKTCYFCQFRSENKCSWNLKPQSQKFQTLNPIQIFTTSEEKL